jgi:hypothetical protein
VLQNIEKKWVASAFVWLLRRDMFEMAGEIKGLESTI